jgi:MazG family protein
MSEHSKHYDALVKTVEDLRAPGGCPWDQEQTHQSLTECLVEECSELLEAIDNLDYEHMQEELGDVMLNVIMQAVIAKESGHFDIEDVCRLINEKLIRRHPHVFGDNAAGVSNSDEVTAQWEAIKSTESGSGKNTDNRSPFKPYPPRLPALIFAKKCYKQIQKLGLQDRAVVEDASIRSKAETFDEDTIGRALFELAAVCRLKGLDPELLTRKYTQNLVDQLSESA